jgi:hypothetical protein
VDAPFERDATTLFWLRIAVLALVVAGLELPINDLFRYALLVLAAVAIFAGQISSSRRSWGIAAGIVALTIAAQWLWPAPRIEEGHNVFVVEERGGALERGLPADAFRQMLAEFEAAYPAARRCEPQSPGCWLSGGFPDRAYAFSTDSIYSGADYSRRLTDIDFADPIFLRLGFINDLKYNWGGTSDLQRGHRNRFWNILHRWQLTMPYFVMYRFPPDFVGSRLCWRGLALWEQSSERFNAIRHAELDCRPIESADIDRRIFGVSIAAPLAMTLERPIPGRLRALVKPASALIGVVIALLVLVRWRRDQIALPLIFVGLALLVVLLDDSTFLGGVRPFEGGDDGLFYESLARQIVRHLLDGDVAQALEGGEKVFYYGGPGLRYLRAAEHFVFGDSFLGYLSLILFLPFVVFATFRRFFGARRALAFTLVFIAVPIGAVFGTTFFQYMKWAARGFADPAAATVFLGGFIVLVGRTAAGPAPRFAPAFGTGLLFALALWLRPNLAPGAGILLGGAGIAALWQHQIRRVAGLCFGFLPMLGMALHNWVFGGALVLFSANASIAEALPMPPKDYVAAFRELLRLDMMGEHVRRGAVQIARWLSGPSESFLMVPLHAAAIVVLVRVAFFGRRFDPWLRLTAGAMLAQHPVALFYLSYGRYYYLAWLLTFLVCAVWTRDEGLDLFGRACPRLSQLLEDNPMRAWLTRVLDWWTKIAAVGVANPR